MTPLTSASPDVDPPSMTPLTSSQSLSSSLLRWVETEHVGLSGLSELLSAPELELFSQGLELAYALFGDELVSLCLDYVELDQGGRVRLMTDGQSGRDDHLALWALAMSGALSEVESLTLSDTSITSLDWLDTLDHVRELTLERCQSLDSVAFTHAIPQLERLNLNYPVGSRDHVNHLPPLQALHVKMSADECTYDWSDSPDLRELSVTITPSRQGSESYVTLSQLRFGHFPELVSLSLTHEVHKLNWQRYGYTPHINELPKLQSLSISHTQEINRLDLGSLLCAPDQLTHLSLHSCKRLKTVLGERLTALTHLEITECADLTKLDLSGCQQITHLNLSGCKNLERVEGLEQLIIHGQLRTLRLGGCERLRSLYPLDHCLALEDLDLSGLNLLAVTELPPLSGLKRLSLGGTLRRAELDLSGSHQLTSLKLKGCHEITSLKRLRDLESLTELDLRACHLLDSSSLIESLAHLTQLEALHLSHVDQLTSLEPLAHLQALRVLTINDCSALVDIRALTTWASLTHLDLSGCEGVTSSADFECLQQLKSLHLNGCSGLMSWEPRRVFPELESLELNHTEVSAVKITASPRLRRLSLNESRLLSELCLRQLPELLELELEGLTELTDISLSELPRVRDLYLLQSERLRSVKLKEMSGIETFNCPSRSIEMISYSDLDQLSQGALELLAHAPKLSALTLRGLPQVESLLVRSPQLKRLSVTHMTGLSSVDLSGCERLSVVSDLSGLSALTSLNLNRCKSLECLSELIKLEALTDLTLSDCEQLRSLPLKPDTLTALTHLNLKGCSSLETPPDLTHLRALTHLDLSGCDWVRDLSWLNAERRLQHLTLRGCQNLRDVRGVQEYTELRALDQSGHHPELLGVIELRALTQLELLWPSHLWKLVPRAREASTRMGDHRSSPSWS